MRTKRIGSAFHIANYLAKKLNRIYKTKRQKPRTSSAAA
jgi:hypothetical protein